MTVKNIERATVLAAFATCSLSAPAADWSDTYIGYRYGTKFAEPFNNQDIAKNIVNLQHVSGYKYGVNFFNVDLLFSNSKDPSIAPSAAAASRGIATRRIRR